jgi:SPP1 family predicted phage head-tail adaptor
MRLSNVIDLVNISDTINENGFPKKTVVTRRTVFAIKKSIQNKEFYIASQHGFQLSLMFEIRLFEYNSENFVEFDNKTYQVIRTYEKGQWLELICQAYEEVPKSGTQ